MTVINDINELNKILRKYLIMQSQMPSERVRNALSTYGETLDKLLNRQTYDTICPCEELMLFELRSRKSPSDKSMTESDGSVSFFKSFELYVILYGDNAATIISNLIARLRTENCRLALLNEGVYLEEVTEDESMNEFKNDTMWKRHDCSLYISCKLKVDQVMDDVVYDSINKVNIIQKGE